MDDVEGDAVSSKTRGRLLAICAWCALAVAIEVLLYVFYFAHEARFRWFTHFFIGASAALLLMSAVSHRTRRPVPLPLFWPVLGHVVAMFPDFLFGAGSAHRRWMDVFLGHLSTPFIPGRNWTWYSVFLVCLALYLKAAGRYVPQEVAEEFAAASN
jgi:hypothetical protein